MFKHPASKLVFERSSFLHPKSRHKNVVEEHYYNYSVDIIVPQCAAIPQPWTTMVTSQHYYMVKDMPLTKLLDMEVINGFGKAGWLYMLSSGTQLDHADCAALTPSGIIVLNLTKETYTKLGLDGKMSSFGGKNKVKYVVKIDTSQPWFKPDNKQYKRVQQRLQELDLIFTFTCSWVPKDEKVCPSSIAVYLKNSGFKVKKCRFSSSSRTLQDVQVPSLKSDAFNTSCPYMDMYEWLGAVACHATLDGLDDGFLSTYSCSLPNERTNNMAVVQHTGFHTPHVIIHLLNKLREYTKEHNLPWSSITVHGFADSPLSWKHNEHGFHNSGDNLYTYVVFPNDDYWLFMAVGTDDICP